MLRFSLILAACCFGLWIFCRMTGLPDALTILVAVPALIGRVLNDAIDRRLVRELKDRDPQEIARILAKVDRHTRRSVGHGIETEFGLCERCGYDLRSNAGQCPECGWRIPLDFRRRSLAGSEPNDPPHTIVHK